MAKKNTALAAEEASILKTLSSFGSEGVRAPGLWQAGEAWTDREEMKAFGERITKLIDKGLIGFNYDSLPATLVITSVGKSALKSS
jgi:hypothetical protein